MGRSGRVLGLLRPYTLLFTANIAATLVAALLDGATFVLVIPFLRAVFKLQALPTSGSSAVERVLERITGPLLTGGAPEVALRNVVLVLVVALVVKNAAAYGAAMSSVAIEEGVVRDLRVRRGGVRGGTVSAPRPPLPQTGVARAGRVDAHQPGERDLRGPGHRADLSGGDAPRARRVGVAAPRGVHRVHRRRAAADVADQGGGAVPHDHGGRGRGGGPLLRGARGAGRRGRPAGRDAGPLR